MTTEEDVSAIVAGLTKAQDRTIRYSRGESYSVFCTRGTARGLMRIGVLVDDGGYPSRLNTFTPLGLRVRSALLAQTEGGK